VTVPAAKLIIDSPDKESSLIYKSSFYCIDPIVYLELEGRNIGWLPSTEIEKARKVSTLSEVYNLHDAMADLHALKSYPSLKSSIVVDVLKKYNITQIEVPARFPVLEAKNLEQFGFEIIPVSPPFYVERLQKTTEEKEFIRENSRLNVSVMNDVHNLLGAASIADDQTLVHDGIQLTSEWLQKFILKRFIDVGLFADQVIVAVGDQGCFPHEYGSGPLYAGRSIIVDIFPRNRSNHYHTDMTRTFCKGKAPDGLSALYDAVLQAQLFGLDSVRSGVDGKAIHSSIQDFFSKHGYETGLINGILQGFFHGTGHGLGLDCHEAPYISRNSSILLKDACVSVEPGLYYMGLGGVRIEDLVIVHDEGCEVVTEYPKKLEIE
jgi:Xaa-Pro aminopeptidase